jgi:2-polyprenyl-3-methyl-5-hydroxy-6-metoxy-1,4-benzoquinol methylase
MSKEEKIIESWNANAANWIDIIECSGIESRRLVTNKAIIDAVIVANPKYVWDLGCGEGWLSAALQQQGMIVAGTDGIAELIEKAKQRSPADFFVVSYEDIASRRIAFGHLFDAIVINFALIGKESTENLLMALPSYLSAAGKLFIQTLHPFSRKAMNDYNSGWKEGSWDGLGDQFVMPYQWYFRTLEDWLRLFRSSGFASVRYSEHFHPQSGNPLSIIFECSII